MPKQSGGFGGGAVSEWPKIEIARVLVKLANRPAPPGNYFYAVAHKPEKTRELGTETETYVPLHLLLEVEEVLGELRDAYSDLIEGVTPKHPNWCAGDREEYEGRFSRWHTSTRDAITVLDNLRAALKEQG